MTRRREKKTKKWPVLFPERFVLEFSYHEIFPLGGAEDIE
jgi:hypothetical protein